MFFLAKKGLNLAIAAFLMLITAPVKAMEVKITPDNPELGDTISVIVTTDTPGSEPQLKMGQQSYRAFTITTSGNRYRALLPTSPLDKAGKILIQVTGDGETKNLAVWLRNRSFPTQRIQLSEEDSQPATELELNRVAQFKELITAEKYWNGAFVRPNAGRISSVYGIRRYYNGVFAQDYYHRGVDYAGGYGSPVVAPAAGVVKLVGRESEGFRIHGNTVGIDHGQGVVSIFLHLNGIDVREGDYVQAGQKIGTIGSTGASTGPHLHWGLYVHGVSVDPAPWRFGGIE